VPDRDLGAWLPEVELADLARSIDGALERPWRRQEQRPHLAQVVVDDRLAAVEPQRHDQLPDPLAGHPRLDLQQPVDLGLERIELRPHRRAPIDRRLVGPQRPADRVAIDPEPPRQLLDRDPANEVLAPQLGPPLHVQQPLPPGQARVRTPPDRTSGG
jgi:hypothetical protein